jgi:hypothetical protein
MLLAPSKTLAIPTNPTCRIFHDISINSPSVRLTTPRFHPPRTHLQTLTCEIGKALVPLPEPKKGPAPNFSNPPILDMYICEKCTSSWLI